MFSSIWGEHRTSAIISVGYRRFARGKYLAAGCNHFPPCVQKAGLRGGVYFATFPGKPLIVLPRDTSKGGTKIKSLYPVKWLPTLRGVLRQSFVQRSSRRWGLNLAFYQDILGADVTMVELGVVLLILLDHGSIE